MRARVGRAVPLAGTARPGGASCSSSPPLLAVAPASRGSPSSGSSSRSSTSACSSRSSRTCCSSGGSARSIRRTARSPCAATRTAFGCAWRRARGGRCLQRRAGRATRVDLGGAHGGGVPSERAIAAAADAAAANPHQSEPGRSSAPRTRPTSRWPAPRPPSAERAGGGRRPPPRCRSRPPPSRFERMQARAPEVRLAGRASEAPGSAAERAPREALDRGAASSEGRWPHRTARRVRAGSSWSGGTRGRTPGASSAARAVGGRCRGAQCERSHHRRGRRRTADRDDRPAHGRGPRPGPRRRLPGEPGAPGRSERPARGGRRSRCPRGARGGDGGSEQRPSRGRAPRRARGRPPRRARPARGGPPNGGGASAPVAQVELDSGPTESFERLEGEASPTEDLALELASAAAPSEPDPRRADSLDLEPARFSSTRPRSWGKPGSRACLGLEPSEARARTGRAGCPHGGRVRALPGESFPAGDRSHDRAGRPRPAFGEPLRFPARRGGELADGFPRPKRRPNRRPRSMRSPGLELTGLFRTH